MYKLSNEKRSQILMALIEGNSIASTCRMTGAAKMTVLTLLREVGESCQRFHDRIVRYLDTRFVQCDEVWSFCYAEAEERPGGPARERGLRLGVDLDRARPEVEAHDLVGDE